MAQIPESWVDPNVRFVTDAYPMAYRCSDSNGFYILDGKTHEEIGRAKKPAKAWKDAAQRIIKARKKGKVTGLKSPKLKTPRKRKSE